MSPYYQQLRARVGTTLLLCPSVAAVIHDAGKRILLQCKGEDEGWSLPAGVIEPGETPQEAVVREVREETGLIVRPAEILGVFGGRAFRHTYPNGDAVEYTVIVFQCTTLDASGQPTDAETERLLYFAREDMPRLALPYPIDVFFQLP